MSVANELGDKGAGIWFIRTYQPKLTIGPISAHMQIAKDFHTFYNPTADGNRKIVASIPSQNIAYILDGRYVPSALDPDDEDEINAMNAKE